MFLQRFQCVICWIKVKYARITITHVCFIVLTLAGSLGRCLNTRPIGEKTCVIPIVVAPRGFGDLERVAIYFQLAGEHW